MIRTLCMGLCLWVLSAGLPSVWAMGNHSQVLRDQYGRALGGATVTVYNAGTATPASIFSDNGVTAKSNPFLTNAFDGSFNFYADNGVYDLVFSYPDATFDASLTRRISVVDGSDLTSGGGGGGVSGWPSILTGAAATSEAAGQAVSIRGTGAQANNGRDQYQGSDGNFYDVCVVAGVRNACNYNRKLAAGYYLDVQNASGTTIFRLTNDTGALTNVTLNAESAGNTITLPEERHFAVASCQGSTAQAVFDLPASNFPAAICDTGTNTQKGYLAFDATTDESFQDHWILPTGFTGAIDIHVRWKAAATTGSVAWCAQLIRVPDGATSDPTFPAQATGNCVSDAAKGTTLQENTATITGVTCTSCAAGDHVYVRISRDPDSTSTRTDDMSGDALLLTYGRTMRLAL